MRSNLKDRCTVSFYEETLEDMILLEYLNRIINRKFRGQAIKELALKYIKEFDKDTYNKLELQVKRQNFNDEISVTTTEDAAKEKQSKPKKTLKGMESWF